MVEVEFEYDEAKSQLNLRKHGISFAAAARLWQDPYLLQVPARTEGEPRFLAIGVIEATVWSAIFTYRGSSVRLISVRRARTEEKELYGREDL
jgi:uncharacterized DUF497 family protein